MFERRRRSDKTVRLIPYDFFPFHPFLLWSMTGASLPRRLLHFNNSVFAYKNLLIFCQCVGIFFCNTVPWDLLTQLLWKSGLQRATLVLTSAWANTTWDKNDYQKWIQAYTLGVRVQDGCTLLISKLRLSHGAVSLAHISTTVKLIVLLAYVNCYIFLINYNVSPNFGPNYCAIILSGWIDLCFSQNVSFW